jgi:tetratricopeptide (TPR) repeat protein
MKRYVRIVGIAMIVCFITFAYPKDRSKAARDYKKALKKIEAGNLKVDFQALRLDCAAAGDSCQADAEIKKNIQALLDEKKFDEALIETDKALKKAFVDIDLHYFAYIANKELGNSDKAKFHMAVFIGLLDSIRERQHGRSKKRAFVVISFQEEDAFLKFNRMHVWKKTLLNEDDHFYDEVVCTDIDTEEDITYYFNLDIPLSGVLDMFEQKK